MLSAGDGKHALSRLVSSVDILSNEEKLAFRAHVQTLRDLGLTYVKDGGTFDYGNTNNLRLEPEIDPKRRQRQHGGGAAAVHSATAAARWQQRG